MANLHYLTVQDVLWINLQATKKVQHFQYAKLEEATFYQYAYGSGCSLLPQAARFLPGFIRMHPFSAGNEATALVGCAAFLGMNGYGLSVPDAEGVSWLDKILTRQVSSLDAITTASSPLDGFHPVLQPDVKGAINSVLAAFETTVRELCDRSAMAK